MSDSDGRDQPNEPGVAGGATTPEVEREPRDDRGLREAEGIAVPGDDLTSAISKVISRSGGQASDREEKSEEGS